MPDSPLHIHRNDRIPVERLVEGDIVRAVEGGPLGKVLDPDNRGWTLVEYSARGDRVVLPYRHGERLILCDA